MLAECELIYYNDFLKNKSTSKSELEIKQLKNFQENEKIFGLDNGEIILNQLKY